MFILMSFQTWLTFTLCWNTGDCCQQKGPHPLSSDGQIYLNRRNVRVCKRLVLEIWLKWSTKKWSTFRITSVSSHFNSCKGHSICKPLCVYCNSLSINSQTSEGKKRHPVFASVCARAGWRRPSPRCHRGSNETTRAMAANVGSCLARGCLLKWWW